MAIHLRAGPQADIRPLPPRPDSARRELFVARHLTNIAHCIESQAFLTNVEAWETTIHGALDAIAARIAAEGEASANEDVAYIHEQLLRRVNDALTRRRTGAA